jgi:hypothetical protein
MAKTKTKHPAATLDYTVDWTDWLALVTPADTIAAAVWTVPAGITSVLTTITTTTAVIWLSGGTSGQSYNISVKITTAAGRIDDYLLTIFVQLPS